MSAGSFPKDFLWGAATAAYQIEGSPLADGAGPSIWQRYTHDGRMMVAQGDTGDIAADHYRRWESDVALMRDLGLQAYRFSTAWGRIQPEGRGPVNAAGIDFYSRLVDRLLENGIAPMLTLFHWDLPVALDDRGGWLNPDSADWFADYASILYRALGDRVAHWVTLNEPWVVADGGYLNGTVAPGHRNVFEAPIAAHNLMRAHGKAVQAYRAIGDGEIGLVVNIEPKYPASDSPADLAATARADAQMNRHYIEPALTGAYPPELADVYGEAWPEWPADDLQLIHQPIDFIGINYYTRAVVRDDPQSFPTRSAVVPQAGATYTETGWEVAPDAFRDMLIAMARRYPGMPIYVTENGAAFADPAVAGPDGVQDGQRCEYLRSHIAAVGEAIAAGVDIRGYMAWSLLDNLEWSLGYAKRFGIVHVDYATQRRTPKDSAALYSRIIANNGVIDA
ncbi:GH1 family beta-glucosidase [Sphingosinithalassobacter portus]|uniref:GH1 family beta-glucosidase n=1 Tax=Stakelama portus TaxID=2676234 RepID=UPI000D6DF0F6|nr:GH1 family beta-glucosidase [Sphingosinithalassobacter portus]